MEDVISGVAVDFLLDKARVEMERGGYETTRTELREKQVKLKLATDKKVQEDIVKKDEETIRRLEQRNKELTEALENGLDRKSWNECELCSQEFKDEGDRVPKLLKCGDTLCWGCIKHLANPDFLICPFDGTVFAFTEFNNINHLHKNLKVL
ncbi:hypothetical protein GCK72_009048 [Caenorhabditis remanei]|uniref:RING-type domain-containing protein n=1 Tax=Caenorhabditis remanei TaxID=31234 RepID=A0A6A5GZ79_CAERE|nr:hypothetical protein GCK72_009048 [Caenorhabditis remanei]KAF1760798.1 hypothetical protein GCK72_009048 [Caenorhabditis remanei]